MTAGDMIEEITEAEEAAPLRGTDTDTGIALFRETESTVIGTAERIDRTGEMSVTTMSERESIVGISAQVIDAVDE